MTSLLNTFFFTSIFYLVLFFEDLFNFCFQKKKILVQENESVVFFLPLSLLLTARMRTRRCARGTTGGSVDVSGGDGELSATEVPAGGDPEVADFGLEDDKGDEKDEPDDAYHDLLEPPDVVGDEDGAGLALVVVDGLGVEARVVVFDAFGDERTELLAVGLGGDDGDGHGQEAEEEDEEEQLGGEALAEGLLDGVAGRGDDDLDDGGDGAHDDDEEVEDDGGDEDAPEQVAVGAGAEAAEGEAREVAPGGGLVGVEEEDERLDGGEEDGERDD